LPTIGEDAGFVPRGQTVKLSAHPTGLLEAIKQEAQRSGIPYQRFIRQALENAVHLHK